MVLVPVLLSVPWLLKVSLPLLTEIVSDCKFHVAPGSLMIVAPCIWKELLPVNVAVPKFSSVRVFSVTEPLPPGELIVSPPWATSAPRRSEYSGWTRWSGR